MPLSDEMKSLGTENPYVGEEVASLEPEEVEAVEAEEAELEVEKTVSQAEYNRLAAQHRHATSHIKDI